MLKSKVIISCIVDHLEVICIYHRTFKDDCGAFVYAKGNIDDQKLVIQKLNLTSKVSILLSLYSIYVYMYVVFKGNVGELAKPKAP